MAMQLHCRACPNIADNPPLPQLCKEVLHPCRIEAKDIVILLLVFTQNFPTNMRDGKCVKMVENGQKRVTIQMRHIPNA